MTIKDIVFSEKKFSEMTLSELKEEKQKYKDFLKLTYGCGSFYKKARAISRENIERLDFAIWKKEDPASFENHKKALQDFVENTHIF